MADWWVLVGWLVGWLDNRSIKAITVRSKLNVAASSNPCRKQYECVEAGRNCAFTHHVCGHLEDVEVSPRVRDTGHDARVAQPVAQALVVLHDIWRAAPDGAGAIVREHVVVGDFDTRAACGVRAGSQSNVFVVETFDSVPKALRDRAIAAIMHLFSSVHCLLRDGPVASAMEETDCSRVGS